MSQTPEILRQFARIELESDIHLQLIEGLENYLELGPSADERWTHLIRSAERHGLGPLLSRHLDNLKVELPDSVRHQLLSLVVRHRRANRVRVEAAVEIINAYRALDIEHALLKGIALANELYPEAALRPMSDIDILVPARRAADAQQALRDLGYAAESHKTGYLSDHHHLPMATRRSAGVDIGIEVHHDALSSDVSASIAFDNLSGPLRSIRIGDTEAQSLGVVDTLRHLCHHTFEPVPEIKLGAIADLYGYAEFNRDNIDFDLLDRQWPFVRNVFRMLHFVSPLPSSLRQWAPPSDHEPPAEVGRGYPPMTVTLAGPGYSWARHMKLFQAPDWWLHAYYAVPPECSIRSTRLTRHPLRVFGWLGRRAWARWRPNRPS